MRFKVYVGEVPVGSDHPIATQTMQQPRLSLLWHCLCCSACDLPRTTTLTSDVEATVAQAVRSPFAPHNNRFIPYTNIDSHMLLWRPELGLEVSKI